MTVSKTVIISCAGMGKRLGIGTTKCLVDVDGEPLILRHLKMLDDVKDVRVVVGYQAGAVIAAVTDYRPDVTFVFNHDYAHNGTGASVSLASKYANDYVLTIDGDLLIHPDDMRKILAADGEFIGVTAPGTDNPVLTDISGDSVVGFSREHGSFEWTGVTQVRSERIVAGEGHVYQLIEPYLPMPYLYLRTKEIDTPNDYDNAVKWVRNGYSDNVVVGIVGGMGSYATVDFFRRMVDAFPARYEWDRPRVIIDNYCTMPSRVRAILYGERRGELVEQLASSTRNLINAGATHVFYACNTSHVFMDEVRNLVPDAERYLVSMIGLLASDVRDAGVSSVYLLASEGTIATGIYQDVFSRYDIEVVPADDDQQHVLREFIEVVKQNRLTVDEANRFVGFLAGLEMENVILGCTELPVLYGAASCVLEDKKIFDPMESAISFVKKEFGNAQKAQDLK